MSLLESTHIQGSNLQGHLEEYVLDSDKLTIHVRRPNQICRSVLSRIQHDHIMLVNSPMIGNSYKAIRKLWQYRTDVVVVDDLRVHARIGVVKYPALDVVLGPTFIDCRTRDMFPSKREAIPWHSRAVSILLSLRTVSSSFSITSMLNVESANVKKSNDVYHERIKESNSPLSSVSSN